MNCSGCGARIKKTDAVCAKCGEQNIYMETGT